jgi:hypothetical protein
VYFVLKDERNGRFDAIRFKVRRYTKADKLTKFGRNAAGHRGARSEAGSLQDHQPDICV